MMKIGIIGPSKIDDFLKSAKIDKEVYYYDIDLIAKIIAKSKNEIIIVPDKRSISYLFSKIYADHEGKKTIGIIPMDDNEFGIDNIDEEVVDEIINCVTWRNQAVKFVESCDLMISLGFGAGTISEIMATKNYKCKVIIIEDFITSRLPKEAERDLNVIYIRKEEVTRYLC